MKAQGGTLARETACISLLMSARPAIVAAAAILCLWSTSAVCAQHSNAAGEARPSFEVVSVKPSSLHENDGLEILPDGLVSKNLPLKEVLHFAYDLRADDQLAGAPSWVNSEHYDIDAKESGADSQQMSHLSSEQRLDRLRLMVRSLLADRFKLRVSFRSERLPAYGLLVAKGGPKLVASVASEGNKADGPPQRQIQLQASEGSGTDDPGIFTALEEQLGLKLVAKKAPIEFLIVDAADKTPTEN